MLSSDLFTDPNSFILISVPALILAGNLYLSDHLIGLVFPLPLICEAQRQGPSLLIGHGFGPCRLSGT